MTHPTTGQRVRMCSTAYVGRQGTVAGTQQIDAGGHGKRRLAVLVDLDATPRAKARRIRCYPTSYVLETR